MVPASSLLLLALLSAPPTVGADLPARPAPTDKQEAMREVTVGRYRLKPKASGGYRVQTDSFIAWIAADGAVNFEKPPRLPGPAVLPAIIAGEILSGRSSNKVGGPARTLKKQVTNPSLILADDDLRNDPQHGPKMDFLEETAAFRADLQRRNDRSALGWFRKRAEDAASDRQLPARQRRANLFALWLDCDEGERGAPARAVVEQTIRRHFPASSPEAYPPQELAAFNQGLTGSMRFDPYRPSPGR